ncbi:MAG: hypothetical protein H6730_09770 [Deltaproteobacteria bacterium]|nr:hypothetical protein [Deltaproteobacteria bacterium]
MSKKSYMVGGFALLLIGCNGGESNFIPLWATVPGYSLDEATGLVTCDGELSEEQMLGISVDVSIQSSLTLYVLAENRAMDQEVILGNGGQYTPSNQITPLRFDFHWECDSTGFTADLGPLYVPAFSATQPFCLDKRGDAEDQDFKGADTISASGPAIIPSERGHIEVQVVPSQLIEGIYDTFEFAKQADLCCDQAGGCQEVGSASVDASTECGKLQALFDTVAGENAFSANTIADVQRWRPFLAYTSVFTNSTGKRPSQYAMRLRGRFEGMTPSGDLITSSEYATDIGFCEGCVFNAASLCLNY